MQLLDAGSNGFAGKNEEYERRFAELFNLATTTFCLCAIQPRPDEYRFAEDSEFIYRRPPADRPVRFAEKYGLALKGQPLLCDSWHPTWAPKDADNIKRIYREFFEKVALRYGDSPYYLARFDGFYGDYEIKWLQDQNLEQVAYTKTPGAWDVNPNRHIPVGKFSLNKNAILQRVTIK